jgi:hypothetical protein
MKLNDGAPTRRAQSNASPARWLLCILMATIVGPAESASSKQPSSAEVSFRDPPRTYQRRAGQFSIYVERSLLAGDSELADEARRKLELNLAEVFATLPERARTDLGAIRFYLLWGKDSPEGGRESGMSYIRQGEPRNRAHLDPNWNHVIVVYSAVNLMYLNSAWTKKTLMHELAHAWHIMHWPEKHPAILQPYQQAKTGGLYRNVKDLKGKSIPEAYALKNQLEYFAELSAMYFVGCNYFPFDRSSLVDYDPMGVRMVRSLWGLQ